MTNEKYILTDKIHKLKVVDLFTWGRWLETAGEKRRVGDDTVNGVRVSTVFLGLDHNWGKGKPLVFETMIFGGERDGEIERYATWKEAERSHKEVVDSLQDTKSD